MMRYLEKELMSWKEKEEHLPILLRGARQVGKSHLIEHFGKTQFEDIAVVDFESRPELKGAFSSRDPKEILTRLEFALRKPIKAGQSLLSLDEIQECREALSAPYLPSDISKKRCQSSMSLPQGRCSSFCSGKKILAFR